MTIAVGFGAARVKRAAIFVGVTAMATVGTLTAAPAAVASTAHVASTVTSVSLTSSETKVTSSTKHKLRVELDANQVPGSAAGSNVVVTLGSGPLETSETHSWTFPVPSTALKVSSAGQGTLKVPTAKISPYGQVSLKITPTGTPKTESCNGTPSDGVQKVKLVGTFYFNSKSTGSHKWGAVGSKSAKKKFTFSSTNTLTSNYLSDTEEASLCNGGGEADFPCTIGVIWDDSVGDVDITGVSAQGVNDIDADRLVRLSAPANATRDDNVSGTGPLPMLTTTLDPANEGASNASLAVTADSGAIGGVTIASADSTSGVDVPCSGGTTGQTVNASLWDSCTYTNGATPLSVAAEVFGPVSLPDNTDASIIDIA